MRQLYLKPIIELINSSKEVFTFRKSEIISDVRFMSPKEQKKFYLELVGTPKC